MAHHQTQYGVTKERLGQEGNEVARDDKPSTNRMAFTTKAVPRPCQVEGCSGQASTQTATIVHFWHRHVRDTVVILEEGNLSHPWLPLCDMLMPWKALNGTHRCT